MVNFLVFVCLLIAGIAQAAVVPSGVPQVNIGGSGAIGATVADPASKGFVTLMGSGYSGTNQAIAFYKNGVRYQVPSGKYFHVVSLLVIPWSTGANTSWGIIHSLTTWDTGADYTSLTGAVWCNSTGGKFCFLSGSAYVPQTLNVSYDFPASSYPGYFMPTGSQMTISAIGYEVTGTAP